MNIHFLPDAPGYRDTNLTIEFAALVDGRRVPCAILVETLEDHFGVETYDSLGWISAFDAGRARIEAVAREHLRVTNGMSVLLKSGHFPPGRVPALRSRCDKPPALLHVRCRSFCKASTADKKSIVSRLPISFLPQHRSIL
ncbi:Transcriptional regulator [Candidatus Burkholderia pumila]|uniref:Transcriptional regulator n=1 Tax=Candidatus Burkholderia pumila TaxID=1090375 RepID=A0ABR5HKX1_9BURK|nr:Transcriptional regulator [Candidatus Burkholderia pumila]